MTTDDKHTAPAKAHDKTNILVIKLGALGDFIQALGPMRAIRHHHPDAHITLLTTAPFEKFARECGYFDEILLDTRPRFTDPRGWLALRKTLNAPRFTRVYDLQNNDRTALYLKLFAPRPEWVGAAKGASHRNANPDRSTGHAFEGHVQTLALAGITNIQIDTLDWLSADTSGFAIKEPFVLLVPGSAPDRPEKRWPSAHYIEIAQTLAAAGYQPVILGTIAEVHVTNAIAAACPSALNLTGRTNLAQIVSLAHRAAAALGNDTGPLHLIAATGCKTVALFSGHSHGVKHAPRGAHVTILQETLLDGITPQRALSTLDLGIEP